MHNGQHPWETGFTDLCGACLSGVYKICDRPGCISSAAGIRWSRGEYIGLSLTTYLVEIIVSGRWPFCLTIPHVILSVICVTHSLENYPCFHRSFLSMA